MTVAEKALWEQLRDRKLSGLKFRRQYPVGPFIADFYCARYKLVVEVDGDIHDLALEVDEQRTRQLNAYGYHVIRFKNDEVQYHIDQVLNKILSICNLSPLLPVLGEGAGDEG